MISMRLDSITDTLPSPRFNEPGTRCRNADPIRIRTDPGEILSFLSAPGTFGPGRATRIDTHISHIFLHGARAYKLKRPVNTGFLDFSTPEARQRACRHELEVNRRISGDLYIGLRTVTREPDGLALDGKGPAVDWLVEMVRFDGREQFDILARRGRLTADMVTALARRLAQIHAEAPRRPDCGGASEMRLLTADTVSGLIGFRHRIGGMQEIAEFSMHMRWELAATERLLDTRRRFGFVRHCHADLHLANICLHKGEPTPFDAIEFDDRMASIDVIYDAAFTIMDLLHEGMGDLANRFMNAWLESCRDYTGLRLLPMCMALRAAIRARVLLMTARLSSPSQAAERIEAARSYFKLAQRLCRPGRPFLLAVGGLSGTGKSTLARRLALEIAPGPGAVILRSDAIRKQLYGKPPHETLHRSAYRTEVSARVFTQMLKSAKRALAARIPVILDATFMDRGLRERAAALAGSAGLPFRGLWLDAPDAVLIPRIRDRREDASDATVEVLARQRAARADADAWTQIDASGKPGEVQRLARVALLDAGIINRGEPGIS